MLTLKNNPILTDYQIEILKLFFSSPIGKQFFLTGGTALAAFYLGHRKSNDLDLFTLKDFDTLLLEKTIYEIAKTTNTTIEAKVRTESYYEVYLDNKKQNWIQRIDFVKEQPIVFGKQKKVDFVVVDSLENIASNKILTIYGRLEPKDYLDLYFICKETATDFFSLFEKTKKKDLGLDEFYFANMIAQVEHLRDFPQMLVPLDQEELVKFFHKLAKGLYKKIKP